MAKIIENISNMNFKSKRGALILFVCFFLLTYLITSKFGYFIVNFRFVFLMIFLILFVVLFSMRKQEYALMITYLLISGTNLMAFFKGYSIIIFDIGLSVDDIFFLLWIFFMLCYYRKITIVRTPLKLPILGLILMGVFQVFRSIFIFKCPLDNALRGFIFIAYFIYFFAFLTVMKNESVFKKIIFFFYLLCFYYGISSLLYYLLGINISITGTAFSVEDSLDFYRITKFGEFSILVMIFIALSNFLLRNNNRDKMLWFCFVLLLLFSIFMSFSRGIWIGTIIGALLAILLSFNHALIKRRFISSASAVLLLMVSFIIVINLLGDIKFIARARLLSAYEDVVYNQGTWKDRVERIEFDVLRENWLLGVGYYGGDPFDEFNPFRPRGHNMYNTIMLRYGVVGLFFFSFLWIMAIKRALNVLRKTKNIERKAWVIGIISALIATLFHGLITSRYVYGYGILHTVFLFFIVEYIAQIEINDSHNQKSINGFMTEFHTDFLGAK